MIFVEIVEAPPLLTVQDAGRPGSLQHGISASGPMDRGAFLRAGTMLERKGGTCLEFGTGKLVFRIVGGAVSAAFTGGAFKLEISGSAAAWDRAFDLAEGTKISIVPGPCGNFGIVRFSMDLDVPLVIGSRATNLIAGLGGFEGRVLRAGDRLALTAASLSRADAATAPARSDSDAPIRVTWGLHADMFSHDLRQRFVAEPFVVSARLDRMGVGLVDINGVFAGQQHLSLVSDAVVPGDVQVLGDGSPVVLMRDHQPTGGYPRIATVVGPDLDRLAQMRPGSEVRFSSVSVQHAQHILGCK